MVARAEAPSGRKPGKNKKETGTPYGVPFSLFRFPGIPLLKQLHRRALFYAAPTGLIISFYRRDS